jgi:hypothetical protein
MTATAPRPVACSTLTWPCCLCRRPFTQVALPGTPLAQCCSLQCSEQAEGPRA